MSKAALNALQDAQTIAIKIGTSTLFNAASRNLNTDWLARFAKQVSSLISEGKNIVLIPSAMVGLGLNSLGILEKKPLHQITAAEKRYAAAFGLKPWLKAFEDAFEPYHIPVASMLLAGKNLKQNPIYYKNAADNLITSFENRHLFIVNENDPVDDEQIKYGDNDTLGADVAILCGADLYVILTDIDCLYDRDPKEPGAQPIECVHEITDKIIAMAKGAKTALSKGGMITKLQGAQKASEQGIATIIANSLWVTELFKDSSISSTLILPKKFGNQAPEAKTNVLEAAL